MKEESKGFSCNSIVRLLIFSSSNRSILAINYIASLIAEIKPYNRNYNKQQRNYSGHINSLKCSSPGS